MSVQVTTLTSADRRLTGMGNRFKDLLPYHSLIKAHGTIASIVFLFLIPLAIIFVRFSQGPRWRAVRIHIWIQITVLFLSTVVLILGWFAVGPERSLTNPHHGIGVALYTLVWVQMIGGAIVRRSERRYSRDYLTVKNMVSIEYRPSMNPPDRLSTATPLDWTRNRNLGFRPSTTWA